MSYTIKELISSGREMLEKAGKDSPDFDSKALCSFVMGKTLSEISVAVIRGDIADDEMSQRYFGLIKRRASGEPLQYITGEQEFMGLAFHVDPRVLIPRLDTEILVEKALDRIKSEPLTVLDLCTGSGAIGISIAKLAEAPAAQPGALTETKPGAQPAARQETQPEAGPGASGIMVTLSDLSEDALSVAKENAELNGVTEKVRILKSDLFGSLAGERFDLIVSNPPYIPREVIKGLSPEVKEHEPLMALDGGEDGLDIYRKIVEEAPDHLTEGGTLMIEIGSDQAESVAAVMREDGRYEEAEVTKDLAGLDRVITARTRLG